MLTILSVLISIFHVVILVIMVIYYLPIWLQILVLLVVMNIANPGSYIYHYESLGHFSRIDHLLVSQNHLVPALVNAAL
jgi:hypothetical protein